MTKATGIRGDKKHASSAGNDLLPAWVNPDLDRLLEVKRVEGDFQSWAVSLVELPAGALFARITGVAVSRPSWSSVQAGRNLHIDLNSELVFVNHSCDPTLEWDMERMEIRVSRNHDLKKGDLQVSTTVDVTREDNKSPNYSRCSRELPAPVVQSTPFDCWCGAGEGVCLGHISGAIGLDAERLGSYWINGYISEMLEEASKKNQNGDLY
ncbi:hypothetical protein EKO27_g2878 [Xylaria grammica]|uniref:SET domain-containing protein n=1 Tax=Xylaria grammica TaxID=363999 RepID=A0A439DD24_9PEZI|nr:hypothetical protein EKO27_g2878 [Xylaria grammica]